MANSYPRDGIFNQHFTTIKDSYNVGLLNIPPDVRRGRTLNFKKTSPCWLGYLHKAIDITVKELILLFVEKIKHKISFNNVNYYIAKISTD